MHLLAGVRAVHRLSDLIRDIKKPTTDWVKEELQISKFAWQDGYAAFSVSYSDLPRVKRYIEGQVEHHRVRTFQEEYLELLRQHEIEFDERYLW